MFRVALKGKHGKTMDLYTLTPPPQKRRTAPWMTRIKFLPVGISLQANLSMVPADTSGKNHMGVGRIATQNGILVNGNMDYWFRKKMGPSQDYFMVTRLKRFRSTRPRSYFSGSSAPFCVFLFPCVPQPDSQFRIGPNPIAQETETV